MRSNSELGRFRSIVFFLLFFFSSTGVACVDNTEPDCEAGINYLIYGTSAEPLQIIQADGQYSGFITDVIREVFADSTVTINTLVKPIVRHKQGMETGQAQRWIAYGLNSWRQQDVWSKATFSDVELLPYSLSLGYKDLGEWPPVHENVALDTLKDDKVVWIRGFKYPGTLAFAQRNQFEFERAIDHGAMLNMVEAGHVKYFMEHAARMKYVMKKQGVDVDRYKFFSLEGEVPPTSITLLMSNDLGKDMIDFINHRLQFLADSGRVEALAKSYGL